MRRADPETTAPKEQAGSGEDPMRKLRQNSLVDLSGFEMSAIADPEFMAHAASPAKILSRQTMQK